MGGEGEGVHPPTTERGVRQSVESCRLLGEGELSDAVSTRPADRLSLYSRGCVCVPGSILLGAAQLQQTVLVCVNCVSDLTVQYLNSKLFRVVCAKNEKITGTL